MSSSSTKPDLGELPAAESTQNSYTDQQRVAITMRDRSVAISAGAGCGKTFVLTERFLAALMPEGEGDRVGSQLHQLVAITFTERAAREMRDRVRAKLYDRQANAASAEEALRWQRLIRDLDAARISTFHSFCASLLRSHAVEARLDPQFTVLDQAEANTLMSEVIDDRLRELLAAQEPDVLDLVYYFQVQGLRDRLRELARAATGAELEVWQQKSTDEILDAWSTFHRQEVLPHALSVIVDNREMQLVRRLLAESAEPNEKVMAVRGTLEDLLGNLVASRDSASDLDAIRKSLLVKAVGKKSFTSEADYELFRDTGKKLRDQIDTQQKMIDFDREAARPMAELGQKLLAVTLDMMRHFEQRKQSAAQLEFDDLMELTRQLLSGPRGEAICRQLGGQIDLLMVDEFQDTDPVQDELVRRICGDDLDSGMLFFVGDFKQSIYKFRGARPDVFRDLQNKMSEQGRLPLTLNFRSQPAILQFVNALFHDAFGEDYLPLRAFRSQVAEPPAIEFLWTPAAEKREKGSTRQAREQEADWIARRIRGLIDEQAPLIHVDNDSPPRSVRPGDVAILFRALSDVDLYEQALRKYGLDYYLVGGHAFYAQQEIFDLVNLLRSLASTCDTVSLAGVLRSPFFSLTDETLFWLTRHPQGLYGGLFADNLATEIDDEQRRQVQFAAHTLRYLAEQKDRLPVSDLIGQALARTGYDAVLLTEFMGERKLANLHKLMQMARNFDGVGSFGLPEFITQLTEFVARQPKESPAATQPEDTDVIRLMTIHQSKGLEFPVVVVADMNRKEPSSRESVAFNSELGALVKLPRELRTDESVVGLDLHRKWDAVAEQQERDRLLYVAATRAADYLVLSSSIADLAKPDSSWLKRLAGRFDLETGLLRDELPEDYEEPAVRVTMEEPELRSQPPNRESRRRLKSLLSDTKERMEQPVGDLPAEALALSPRADRRGEFSFSRLAAQFTGKKTIDEETYQDQVRFDSEESFVGGAELGTLVHNVLAETPSASAEQLAEIVDRHANELGVSDVSTRDEASRLVADFLASERATHIAQATEVHREVEFLLAWPPGQPKVGGPRIRGFIDCLYRDQAGDWHVVDYKTNRTSADSVLQVAAQYEMQMLLYGLAAEQALGVAPVSLTLCFLRPGMEHSVAVSEDARQRLAEFVDRAMAADVR